MALTKLKLNESEVTVTIDLEKLLGRAAKDRTVREVFFQAAYDQMLNRLDDGKDFKGRAMKKYSKQYKDSLAYAAFGKDGTVNLTLTGDMINSVEILEQDESKMTIGFDGDLNNKKAYAHMTGYKGHKWLDGKVEKREFFGWTDAALKEIADQLKPSNRDKDIISDEKVLGLLDRLLANG